MQKTLKKAGERIVTSRCYWERVSAIQDGEVGENGKYNFSATFHVLIPHVHSRNRKFTALKKTLSSEME